MAETGMAPWPEGKEREAGNRVDFSSHGEYRRFLQTTNLIIRQTTHLGFGNASISNVANANSKEQGNSIRTSWLRRALFQIHFLQKRFEPGISTNAVHAVIEFQ